MESLTVLRYFEEKKKYFKRHLHTESLVVHSQKVNSVGWNLDGKYLASASSDCNICIMSFDKEKIRKRSFLKGHSSSISKICWSPKNTDYLISCASEDRNVYLWDIRMDKFTQKLSLSHECVNVCYNPNNGNELALSKKNDTFSIYDLRSLSAIREVQDMAWSNSSARLYIAAGSEGLQIYNYENFQWLKTLKANASSCNIVQVDPNDKYFAFGGSDSIVSLFNSNSLICERTFYRLDYPIKSIDFNHDGQLIALSSEDNLIDLSMTELGDQVWDIKCNGPCNSISWHPKYNILAYGCSEKEKSDSSESNSVYIFGLSSNLTSSEQHPTFK